MEVVKDLLQQRKEEYNNNLIEVQGIQKSLKDLKNSMDEKPFGTNWKKYLEKFIEKKEKECDLMVEVCQRNIKAAEGPMTDKDEDDRKVA